MPSEETCFPDVYNEKCKVFAIKYSIERREQCAFTSSRNMEEEVSKKVRDREPGWSIWSYKANVFAIDLADVTEHLDGSWDTGGGKRWTTWGCE